jgi:para-nitrobenzyl esterase
MLDWPSVVSDGYVLPRSGLDIIFSTPFNFNSMPIMAGTNRDENKVFMALDPELVGLGFRVKDFEQYNRTAAYLAEAWKIRGVDQQARLLAKSQGQVYAYRFDWDELPKIGWIDLSKVIGAGHGLEIPFVFGGFKCDFNLDLVFGSKNKEQRKALSDAMMSYWTQFAYTGSPSKGRKGELPEWTAWNNEEYADKFIVLDTGVNGIRMDSKDLYYKNLKQKLSDDSSIYSEKERCNLYKKLFVNAEFSEQEERGYLSFAKGCADYPLR